MCDHVVRRVLQGLNDRPAVRADGTYDAVLPSMLFTNDIDCNGGLYNENMLESTGIKAIRDDDGVGKSYDTYKSWIGRSVDSANLDIAYVNTNYHQKSYYLPRNSLEYRHEVVYAFNSMIFPPQCIEIEIEGYTGGITTDRGLRLRRKMRGPTIIHNTRAVKYDEMYKFGSTGYVPLPMYYSSSSQSSLLTLASDDLRKMDHYDANGTCSVQHRINIVQAKDVEAMIRDSCMGDLLYYGGYLIERYVPQGPFCDGYMRQYCNRKVKEEDTLNMDKDICSCFREEASMITKSITAKVELPVVCNGVDCMGKKSYKTLAMKQLPCRRMLCKQEIQGIREAGENVITCNGTYFHHDAQVRIIQEYYDKAAEMENMSKEEVVYESKVGNDRLESSLPAQPVYVWVCLGISYLLILIFSFIYLFPPSFFSLLEDKVNEQKVE
jgi:hypothetical protein